MAMKARMSPLRWRRRYVARAANLHIRKHVHVCRLTHSRNYMHACQFRSRYVPQMFNRGSYVPPVKVPAVEKEAEASHAERTSKQRQQQVLQQFWLSVEGACRALNAELRGGEGDNEKRDNENRD